MSIDTQSQNDLLARLPDVDFERLSARMHPIRLESGRVLYETGAAIEQIYFPTRATVSAVTTLDDGSVVEVATIGREGMVGLGALLADGKSANEVIVQIAGEAQQVDLAVLMQEAVWDSPLRRILRSYQAAFRTQISYSVVCNMLHSVQQRCCRWLLTTSDRMDSDVLPLTHEFLALMLRLRRACVADVLRPLNDMGLVRSRRGSVMIVDRPGLERATCACYRRVKEGFDRLLR